MSIKIQTESPQPYKNQIVSAFTELSPIHPFLSESPAIIEDSINSLANKQHDKDKSVNTDKVISEARTFFELWSSQEHFDKLWIQRTLANSTSDNK
jgi:hypothetical protein